MPSNTTTNNVSAVLSERGSSYGDFSDNARIAQSLKRSVREGLGWSEMPGYMQEGVDMILSKLSRLVTGNWAHEDNLVDIQGYARLMQDRLPIMRWHTMSPIETETTGVRHW